jgi:hypothetical protein
MRSFYQLQRNRFDSRGDVAKESPFFQAGLLGVDYEGLFRQIRRAIDIFRGSAMIDRIKAGSRCRVKACKCSPSSLLWLAVEK